MTQNKQLWLCQINPSFTPTLEVRCWCLRKSPHEQKTTSHPTRKRRAPKDSSGVQLGVSLWKLWHPKNLKRCWLLYLFCCPSGRGRETNESRISELYNICSNLFLCSFWFVLVFWCILCIAALCTIDTSYHCLWSSIMQIVLRTMARTPPTNSTTFSCKKTSTTFQAQMYMMSSWWYRSLLFFP